VTGLRKLLLAATALIAACAFSGAVAGAVTGRRACLAAHSHNGRGQRCGTHTRAIHRRSRAHPTSRSRRLRNAGKDLRRLRVHSSRQPSATVTVSLPATASSIASVLATPCQNTELMPEPGDLEQIRAATLCLVNQERARNDELPLQPNTQLEQAAQGHSEDMVSEDYFEHIAPDGETPVDRVQATGYIPSPQDGYTLGENIAWGTLYLATPNAIVAAWIASPEHLANILHSEYRDTAIGVAPAAPPSLAAGQAGAVYTQEFGVIVVG
jgi:uncharacterized protein YkwD